MADCFELNASAIAIATSQGFLAANINPIIDRQIEKVNTFSSMARLVSSKIKALLEKRRTTNIPKIVL